jgi:hypothetical protein
VLGYHHATEWGPLQFDDASKPGYAVAESDRGAVFDSSYHSWFPKTTFESSPPFRWSNSLFHIGIIAKVTKKPLAAGSKVRFILGAGKLGIKAPRCIWYGHEFRISVNEDGQGYYQNIEKSPTVNVVNAAAGSLSAVVPSQIIAGKPFDMLIRAEDEFLNIDRSYRGVAHIYDEDNTLLKRNVRLDKGITTIRLTVSETGARRFRLKSKELRGRSNPCKAFTTYPRSRIFWGDLHGHTEISDGQKIAKEYYAFGRDVAGLDVCALTDHGYRDWQQTQEMVKAFYAPHKFVTILALEGGAGADHMNYYFKNDDAAHLKKWASTIEECYTNILKQYNVEQKEVIAGAPHFTMNHGSDKHPFKSWDERVYRFVEIYSGFGTNEYLGNPRPVPGAKQEFKFTQAGLAMGRKFGFIGCSDTHASNPGRTIWGHYPGGLTAFLAPELTREAIWNSLYDRHVYATSLDRIYIEFEVAGHMMGSTVKTSGPCKVKYYVLGKTDNLEVSLVYNNKEIRKDVTANGSVDVSTSIAAEQDNNFLYIRVVQDNGERAWSSPIWIEKPA